MPQNPCASQSLRCFMSPTLDAVLMSGTGLPTVGVLDLLEQDLGKPAISSMQASLWQPLRLAGIHRPVAGFGRWLREG